jgi:hypothetical protein
MDDKEFLRITERFKPVIDRITETMVANILPALKRSGHPRRGSSHQPTKEDQRLNALRESFNAQRQNLELSLRTKPWTDEAISRITDEPLAEYAYGRSLPLQETFPTLESFITYWRALHHGSQPQRVVPRTYPSTNKELL